MAMLGPEIPWDDLHHRSYFLPELRRIEAREFVLTVNADSPCPINPLAMDEVHAEGNMASIATTIPIDISKTPGIVENVFIRADCPPPSRFESTQIYLKNPVTFLPSLTRKC